MKQQIWHGTPTVEQLNAMVEDTMDGHLGMRFTEVGPDYVRGALPHSDRTRQPFGLLHGGANAVLAETLASVGANLTVNPAEERFVGLQLTVHHLRGVTGGFVTGTSRPMHQGRSTQVWETKIRDEQGRLSAVSRLTLSRIDP